MIIYFIIKYTQFEDMEYKTQINFQGCEFIYLFKGKIYLKWKCKLADFSCFVIKKISQKFNQFFLLNDCVDISWLI